jgi:hypothetical protein
LENGCAWKRLAGLMKVRSKYSLIRRYKKILRKYQKTFVPNTKEITEEAKKLLSMIIANLQGDKVFFCPLFYKKHHKKCIREKKVSSTSSFSTAASSPSISSNFGQYPKVIINSPSFSGMKEEKKEECPETPIAKRIPKEETVRETPNNFSSPLYEDFSQMKPSSWSFEAMYNNNLADNFFPKNIYEMEECPQGMQPSNEVLITTDNNHSQDAYNFYIKQCLINKFECLHQEMKNTFKPENFISHTPAKPLQHNFHNIGEEANHYNFNNRTYGRITNYELGGLNIYCEADEMINRWHQEDF